MQRRPERSALDDKDGEKKKASSHGREGGESGQRTLRPRRPDPQTDEAPEQAGNKVREAGRQLRWPGRNSKAHCLSLTSAFDGDFICPARRQFAAMQRRPCEGNWRRAVQIDDSIA